MNTKTIKGDEAQELSSGSLLSPRPALEQAELDAVAERLEKTLSYLEWRLLELADEASAQGYHIWVETDIGEHIFSRWGSGVGFSVRKKE